MTTQLVPLLLLDIDGTVRQGKDDALGKFVNGPEDVIVFPEAVEQMRRWKEKGGRIIGVSNQGGIALRIVNIASVAEAMTETQRQTGGLFDGIGFCRHHPHASDPEMARCWCRKPRPGLAIETALDLARRIRDRTGVGVAFPPHLALFVGDRPEDQQCADALNIDFQWAADWRAAVDGQAGG
jgi:D-glycero-D-manno-heptose 1,7-bisphosphate phosphatase